MPMTAPAQPVQGVEAVALEAAARAMCAPFDPDETIYLGSYMKRWESHKESAQLAVAAYLAVLPREEPAAVTEAVCPVPPPYTDRCTCPTHASPAPAPEAPADWQDISTAPKDGTPVLLGYLDKSGKFAARSGYWMPDITHGRGKPTGAWVCTMDTVLLDQRATHWAPLISALASQVDDTKGEA